MHKYSGTEPVEVLWSIGTMSPRHILFRKIPKIDYTLDKRHNLLIFNMLQGAGGFCGYNKTLLQAAGRFGGSFKVALQGAAGNQVIDETALHGAGRFRIPN